jgi:ComF family protein
MEASALRASLAALPSLLLDFVYPPFCLVCDGRLPRGEDLVCDGCWGRATEEGPGRTRHLADGVVAYSAFHPTPTAFSILHEGKYSGRRTLVERLAALLAARARRWPAVVATGAFVPVPLHPVRARARGYNQSAILAAALAAAMGAAVADDLIVRSRDTRPQARLADDARATNVRGAFRLAGPRGRARSQPRPRVPERVAIVDDVVTSGATALECAALLREAGAREVDVVSLL